MVHPKAFRGKGIENPLQPGLDSRPPLLSHRRRAREGERQLISSPGLVGGGHGDAQVSPCCSRVPVAQPSRFFELMS